MQNSILDNKKYRQTQKDNAWLQVCFDISSLATCARRATGCVVVDRHNLVLSTGYNGVPQGEKHCTDFPCEGTLFTSGSGLNTCEAIHAEENALQFCSDVTKIHTIYCTTSPCLDRCLRKLMNTSATRIVFANQYPDPQNLGRTKWENSGWGREFVHHILYDRLWLKNNEENKLPDGFYYRREEGKPCDSTVHRIQSGVFEESGLLYQMIRLPTYERRMSF